MALLISPWLSLLLGFFKFELSELLARSVSVYETFFYSMGVETISLFDLNANIFCVCVRFTSEPTLPCLQFFFFFKLMLSRHTLLDDMRLALWKEERRLLACVKLSMPASVVVGLKQLTISLTSSIRLLLMKLCSPLFSLGEPFAVVILSTDVCLAGPSEAVSIDETSP